MILGTVCDPEIPVLSIEDLGILRDVQQRRGQYIITITPTYTGCPAMQTIEQDMRTTLELNGVTDYTLITRLAPAWTTDWLSEQGRKKLLAFGIAPPVGKSGDKRALTGRGTIVCPQCQSADTSMISEFGSTACKALYKCNSCQEPFDYFKCL
ncbi:MAG: 1,2-phenylacetyl-CoA epoxidase subunit PaaD [Gammaproteobacteria bacterium]